MRAAAARGVVRGLALVGIVVGGVLTGSLVVDHLGPDAHGSASQGVPTAVRTSEPRLAVARYLIDQHDCWTGRAPADAAGRVPGHVVVTGRDGRTVYGGPGLVGDALQQVFGDVDHGLTVWGFCR